MGTWNTSEPQSLGLEFLKLVMQAYPHCITTSKWQSLWVGGGAPPEQVNIISLSATKAQF